MNARAFLPAVALAAATVLLPACVSPGVPLAASESVSPQPCVQVTGSRIVRPHNRTHCADSSMPLKTFSAEEIQSTGETDLASALRRLDPAFQ
jgi:hypothetical protein